MDNSQALPVWHLSSSTLNNSDKLSSTTKFVSISVMFHIHIFFLPHTPTHLENLGNGYFPGCGDLRHVKFQEFGVLVKT